ncbi:hypothetical protein [Aquimarina sp. 2201CG5-10]|uniref:hypothetical protein n=1 Tax=Aquimarina callyspongiae TaxID=3098150 RepID=UPI002AB3989A|nr:hypothetical protein [Aquimarina sp. 2201CG5-10]MDY8134859.1 hypothetical protein [Aquimarina sp. 2201CG5-10]
MKHFYLIFGLLMIYKNIVAQNKDEIKLLATELHSEHYTEKTYPKDHFQNYVVSDSLFQKFPDNIRSFEFSPSEKTISFIRDCDIRAVQLTKKNNKEASALREENLNPCYAKFIQTSPEIRFAFELQNSNAIYHIKEVLVYVYHAKISLSTDKNYFAHKKDEREKLIIDLTKTNQEQLISLHQVHALKDGGLALNLRLFASNHWDESFDKSKALLHISFRFTNGQTIRLEPFMVEM